MVPLGIDKEKLFLQIGRLEENMRRLGEVEEKIEKRENDEFILYSAAEKILQESVDECINIGNHIISGLALRLPDSYREIFIILNEEDIISEDIRKNIESFVIFRNRIVHLYWKVEKKETYQKIKEIDSLKKFIEELFSYLKEKGHL